MTLKEVLMIFPVELEIRLNKEIWMKVILLQWHTVLFYTAIVHTFYQTIDTRDRKIHSNVWNGMRGKIKILVITCAKEETFNSRA